MTQDLGREAPRQGFARQGQHLMQPAQPHPRQGGRHLAIEPDAVDGQLSERLEQGFVIRDT